MTYSCGTLCFLSFSHVCERLRWVSLRKLMLRDSCDISLLVPALTDQCIFFLRGQPDWQQQADRADLLLQETNVSKQESIFQQVKEILFSGENTYLSLQKQQNALGTFYTINITELMQKIVMAEKKKREESLQVKLQIKSSSRNKIHFPVEQNCCVGVPICMLYYPRSYM